MMHTEFVWRKSCLGEENKRDQFLVCAKRTVTKFDLTKAVLAMKLSSPGCPMVTLKSETFLYMSTPDRVGQSVCMLVCHTLLYFCIFEHLKVEKFVFERFI